MLVDSNGLPFPRQSHAENGSARTPGQGREVVAIPEKKRPARWTFGVIVERKSKTTGKRVSSVARYTGPDTKRLKRNFGDRMAAETWFAEEKRLIDRGELVSPAARAEQER